MHHEDNVNNTVAASKKDISARGGIVLDAESLGKAGWDHV